MITQASEAVDADKEIRGVSFKLLKSFPDDRGFFRELIRDTDEFFTGGFAQWSHSKMSKNTVKAWHYHHVQIDWWYLGIGVIHTVLYDNREESLTYGNKLEFKLGEPEADPEALSAIVRIPQGVLHGCKVLSDFAHLFYITSETYDTNDEGRFPFDSSLVAHDWGNTAELIIAPNDRRTFVPTTPRVDVRKPVGF